MPGCGKSYSIRDHFKRHNKVDSLLTVAPWNRLKCEMCADGYKAVTLHKLLGRTVTTDDDRKKPYDLTGITHVHFEEGRLYTIKECEWIRAFKKQHPTLSYSGASDGRQLQPVGQKLAVDHDEYYERAFAELFPNRLTLRFSKRCSTPEEGRRMEVLCEDLLAEVEAVPTVLKRHGIPSVNLNRVAERGRRQVPSHSRHTGHGCACEQLGSQTDRTQLFRRIPRRSRVVGARRR